MIRGNGKRRSRFGVYRCIVAVALSLLLLGAKADKWVRVAEHDLTFAKHLASDGVKFGPEFMDGLVRSSVIGCGPRPSKVAMLKPAEVAQVYAYCAHYCEPWFEIWSKEMRPCDRSDPFVPDWCKAGNEELAASHLGVGPYFGRLTAALRATDSGLERSNIMAVVIDRLDHSVLRDYPQKFKEAWAAEAASVFLERASPEEAMSVGWSLFLTPLGNTPRLAEVFSSYVGRLSEATEEQRRLLDKIAHGLERKGMPEDVRNLLRERFGPPLHPAPPPPPDRTSPSDIALLVERVHAYHRLLRDERFAESWDMLEAERTDGGDPAGYVHTMESLRRDGDLIDWQVERIQIKGDIAQVFLKARYESVRGRKAETTEEYGSCWVFERGSWYMMLPCPPFFEKDNPVEVPLPEQALEDEMNAPN